ncbi:hypothetical protein Tco_0247451 [Tanacetum coccineum]
MFWSINKEVQESLLNLTSIRRIILDRYTVSQDLDEFKTIFDFEEYVEMGNPDITIEEYVQYKTKEALRNNQVYNSKTARKALKKRFSSSLSSSMYAHEEFRVASLSDSAPPPKSKSKPTRGRQKRTYFKSKTKALDRRTYNMINGKWKTVRPNVAQFCGTYANVMRRVHESGARDEDYYNRALLNYEAEQGMQFTLCHCWEMRCMKFDDNGQGQSACLRKKGPRSSGSSSSMNDEALARLMVFELAMHNERAIRMKKEECLAFMEIKKRELNFMNERWQCRNNDNVKKT